MSESRSIEIKLKQTSTGETETIYITQEGKEFVPEYVFTIDEEQRTRAAIQSGDRDVMLGLLKSYKTIESGGTDILDWTLDDDSVRGDGADLDVYVGYGYGSNQYVYVMLQSVNEDTDDKTIYFTIVQEESGKTLDFTVTIKGKEVDTNPKWTSTGELGCSSSSSSYREKTDIYADGYAFVKYRDTNPDSSSYNDTEWRRASNRDDECVGQVDTSPKWEYVDSSSYGCSSNSYSFNEKTDPYADGYAFRLQKDTNPDSDTYGDTKWVRYSSWDSKCVGKERPYQPTYTFTADDYNVTGDSSINITSHKTVKEGGTTHVQWTVDDEITGDGADLIKEAYSAGGNTSLVIQVNKSSYTVDKNAVITLKQDESGKTIKINVTIPGIGSVEPPAVEYTFQTADSTDVMIRGGSGAFSAVTVSSFKTSYNSDSYVDFDYDISGSDNLKDKLQITIAQHLDPKKKTVKIMFVGNEEGTETAVITLTQKESGKKIRLNVTHEVESGYDCTVSPSVSEIRFEIPRIGNLAGQSMQKSFTVSLPNECPYELYAEYKPSAMFGEKTSIHYRRTSTSSRKEYNVDVIIGNVQLLLEAMKNGSLQENDELGWVVMRPSVDSASDERRVPVYAQLV